MPKYFARIEKNIVQEVIVADSIDWCKAKFGGDWVETFMNSPKARYAGKGNCYYPEKKDFVQEKPFSSWKMDSDLNWKPEVESKLSATSLSGWDEATRSWTKSGDIINEIK